MPYKNENMLSYGIGFEGVTYMRRDVHVYSTCYFQGDMNEPSIQTIEHFIVPF